MHQVDQWWTRSPDHAADPIAENWATRTSCSYPIRMHRILLPLASIVALGCTETAIQQSAAVPQAPPVVMIYDGQTHQYGADVANAPGPQREYRRRDVGDFIVYRYTGSIQKAAATLTKRIIGRTGETVEADVILEQGRKKERYRVRFSDAPTNRDEILSAARVEGDRLILISVEKFRHLMARAVVYADENEQLLQSEKVTATVGHEALPAQRNTYRVRIGKKHAVMRSTSSPDFCWGDIEGEIVTAKGDVLYRAEIIHLGNRNIKTIQRTPSVAQSNYDQFE